MSFLNNIQQNLTRYGMSSYLVLGNIENLINIFVFSQKEHRRISCSLYFLCSSIINLFIINYGIIPTLYSLDHPNPEHFSVFFCKIRLYFLHSTLMISRSFVVFACVDRFAICSSSVRIRSFCQCRIAIRLISSICIFWPLVALHIPIFLTIQSNRCGTFGFYGVFYSIYSFIVAGVLPPSLMIIFSSLTIRNFHFLRLRIRPNNSPLQRRDATLILILMSNVLMYLISTTLYPIQMVYLAISRETIKSTEQIQIESFITYLAYSFLIYINSAASFYVNIGISRRFRRDCRNLFIRHFIGRIVENDR